MSVSVSGSVSGSNFEFPSSRFQLPSSTFLRSLDNFVVSLQSFFMFHVFFSFLFLIV